MTEAQEALPSLSDIVDTVAAETPAEEATETADTASDDAPHRASRAGEDQEQLSLEDVADEMEEDSEESEQVATAEAKTEKEPEEEPKQEQPDKMSKRFAALARKEKQLRTQEQQVKQQTQQIQQMQAQIAEFQRTMQAAKDNPLELLRHVGYSYNDLYNDLTEKILAGEIDVPQQQKPAQSDEALKRVQQLEHQLRQKEVDAAQREMQHVVATFQQEIVDTINSSEQYEYIRAFNGYPVVWETIVRHYQETGELVDIKDAADYLESFYENEASNKLLNTKKLKSKFTPASTAPEQSKSRKVKRNGTTLTNSTSASPTTPTDKLDDFEALRAIAATLDLGD